MDILPVGGWQVIQEKENLIKVLLTNITDRLDTSELSGCLESDLKNAGGEAKVVIEIVDEIPKSPADKTPLIKAMKHQIQG